MLPPPEAKSAWLPFLRSFGRWQPTDSRSGDVDSRSFWRITENATSSQDFLPIAVELLYQTSLAEIGQDFDPRDQTSESLVGSCFPSQAAASDFESPPER